MLATRYPARFPVFRTSGEIVFAAGAPSGQIIRFNVTGTFGHVKLSGIAEALAFSGTPQLFVIEWKKTGKTGEEEQYVWEHGPNPPPPPPPVFLTLELDLGRFTRASPHPPTHMPCDMAFAKPMPAAC